MKLFNFLRPIMSIATGASKGSSEGAMGAITGALNAGNDFFESSSRETIEAIRADSKIIKSSNKLAIEQTKHSSLFVAGMRPFIGWVCGLGLGYHFLIYPLLSGFINTYFGFQIYDVHWTELSVALTGVLGLGTMRSFEKVKGIARNSL